MGGMITPRPESTFQNNQIPAQGGKVPIASGPNVDPVRSQPQSPYRPIGSQGGKGGGNIDPVRPRPFENGPGPQVPAQGKGQPQPALPSNFQSPYANYGFDPGFQNWLDTRYQRGLGMDGGHLEYNPTTQSFQTVGGMKAPGSGPDPTISLANMQRAMTLEQQLQSMGPQPVQGVMNRDIYADYIRNNPQAMNIQNELYGIFNPGRTLPQLPLQKPGLPIANNPIPGLGGPIDVGAPPIDPNFRMNPPALGSPIGINPDGTLNWGPAGSPSGNLPLGSGGFNSISSERMPFRINPPGFNRRQMPELQGRPQMPELQSRPQMLKEPANPQQGLASLQQRLGRR